MIRPSIGIDLRPTRVAAAALRGPRLADPVAQPTECSDSRALIDQLTSLVERVGAEDVGGVGIAVPRVVEFTTGCVVSTSRAAAPVKNGAVDLPLADVPLRTLLEERLGLPVFVDNAANMAALAEAHDDELSPSAQYLVMFTVGGGVGGGLVLDGRIYRGASGAAGVLGHTILGLDLAGAVPRPMGFPQPGSLEFVASGHALDRLAALAGRVDPKSELARLRAQRKAVLSAAVVEAALAGDRAAMRMIEIWGQRLGIAVANAIHTFDPQEVVIGGEAARAGALLLGPVRRVALEYVLPGLGLHTTIRLSRHGDRARLLGAALLARYEREAAG